MSESKTLELMLHGELEPWKFQTGHWCGDVRDSVCIEARGYGAVLSREDVTKLIDFLVDARATWDQNPRPLMELIREDWEKNRTTKIVAVDRSPSNFWPNLLPWRKKKTQPIDPKTK